MSDQTEKSKKGTETESISEGAGQEIPRGKEKGLFEKHKEFPAGLMWVIILTSGSIVLFSYYFSIKFLPTFDIKSIATLLAAVAFDSVITISMFGLMFIMPAWVFSSVGTSLSEREKSISMGVTIFWIFASWFGLSSLIFSPPELFDLWGSVLAVAALLFVIGLGYAYKKSRPNLGKRLSLLFYVKVAWKKIVNRYKKIHGVKKLGKYSWLYFKRHCKSFFSTTSLSAVVALGQILPFYIGILVLARSPIGYANVDDSKTIFFIFKVFFMGAALSVGVVFCLLKKKGNIKAALFVAMCSPIFIGLLAETPSLFPTIAARETKTGAFLASQVVLDAEGCRLVKSYLPALQCGDSEKGNYSFCNVFVRSRLGEQHYFTINAEPNPGTAEQVRLKDIIIPSTNVKSLSPAMNDHLAIQDDDIKRQLFYAQRRNAPCGSDGDLTQLIYKSSDAANESNHKPNKSGWHQELQRFVAMAKKPPYTISGIQIYGLGSSGVGEEKGFAISDANNLRKSISQLGISPYLISIDWTGEYSGDCSMADQAKSERCKLRYEKIAIDIKRSVLK